MVCSEEDIYKITGYDFDRVESEIIYIIYYLWLNYELKYDVFTVHGLTYVELLHITLSGRYTIVLDSLLKYGSCSLLD